MLEQSLGDVQKDLIKNNLRYPYIFSQTLREEANRLGIVLQSPLVHDLEMVNAAYKKIAEISEEVLVRGAQNLSRGHREIAKAFWLCNVSWADAFFRDMLFWAENRIPNTASWKAELDGISYANFNLEHYAISFHLNGDKDVRVPFQQSSQHQNPLYASLIDDLRWHELLRSTILRYAPLVLLDGTLRKGNHAFGEIRPRIKRFLEGSRRPFEVFMALTFGRADLEFYGGLFGVFIKHDLFSDNVVWLVKGFLDDYRKCLESV